MSDTNKTLNDLLTAARNEPPQEFVSAEGAERLVASSFMRDVPSMKQTLTQRLLSTPLRLSITAMTSAALITIGTLAVRSLTSNAPQITEQPQFAQAQHQQPHITALAVDSSRKEASMLSTEIEAPALPGVPALPPLPPPPPSPPIAIHAIELDEQHLSQIGVMLKDNGDIDFFTRFKKDGYLTHYGLPPGAGMRIHFALHKTLSDTSLPGFHIPDRAPKLITSVTGAKRLFSLESSSYGDSGHEVHTETIKNFADGSGKIDVFPMFDDDTALQRLFKEPMNGNDHRHIILRSQVKEIDSIAGTPHRVRIQMKQLKLADGQVSKYESDSTIAHIMEMGLDSFRVHMGDHISKPSKIDIKGFTDIDTAFSIFSKDSLVFDRLIPIRVVNYKNAEHPNELIFWYEPTSEITQMLPAQKRNGTMQMPPSFNVSVYPNPTTGPATINYTMKDDVHHADFVVRNLLGQKVLDAGSSDGTSGNISLDLSKLDAGLYLLVTTTDDGEQSVERIVVNK